MIPGGKEVPDKWISDWPIWAAAQLLRDTTCLCPGTPGYLPLLKHRLWSHGPKSHSFPLWLQYHTWVSPCRQESSLKPFCLYGPLAVHSMALLRRVPAWCKHSTMLLCPGGCGKSTCPAFWGLHCWQVPTPLGIREVIPHPSYPSSTSPHSLAFSSGHCCSFWPLSVSFHVSPTQGPGSGCSSCWELPAHPPWGGPLRS